MKKLAKILGGVSVTAVIVALAVRPSVYMPACRQGLDMFLESVFPALFPFFFFTGLLGVFGTDGIIARMSKKPIRVLYDVPPAGGYAMALSFISGYPIGAKTVSESYKNGLMTLDECKRAISFSSTSGPLFVVGVIGYKMLGSPTLGAVLLVVHYVGAVLNGFIFSGSKIGRKNRKDKAELSTLQKNSSFNEVLNTAVVSIVRVGACVVIFCVAVAFLEEIGVIAFLLRAVELLGVSEGISGALVTSLFEVTRGAYMLDASLSAREILPMLSFALGFGGISVAIQSTSFLSEIGIKPGYYFVTKISQAIISYAVATVVAVVAY